MSSNSRRVVVTGLGTVNPLGLTAEESWGNALSAKSGISKITAFDTSHFDVKIAGEVKNFNGEDYIPKKELKRMDRFIQFALASTAMAIEDAGLDFSNSELGEKTGAFIGTGIGGLPLLEYNSNLLKEKGPGRISPFFIPQVIANMPSGHVTIKYGLQGPNYSVTSACATGCHSIGEAFHYIKRGDCQVMIAGGTESTVCGLGIAGFDAMKALSTRNEEPEKASRPWDKDRDGFVLAEGAGVLILEDYEHAKKRGARIYAEVTGYGVSSDAHHMTNPAPEGAGAQKAMRMALKSAAVNAEDVGYINAHGTSTPVGDVAEAQAVHGVFKNSAKSVWVSSTKSMIGHSLGAAGAIESIFSIQALYHGKVPPTINLDNPSDDCDLDFVPHEARERQLKHVLNNSFGFGGTNACLLFSKA